MSPLCLWCDHSLCLLGKHFTLVYPHLNTDDAGRKESLLSCKINIGTNGLQWNIACLHKLAARHICTTQTSGKFDACSLNVAIRHHLLKQLLDHTLEWHTLLKSLGSHLTDYRRIRLRTAHFLYLDLDVFRMLHL